MLNLATEILRLLRRLQQKNRFVSQTHSTGLSLLASHFMIELQADPDRSISDLCKIFKIDASIATRVAQKLTKQDFLLLTTTKSDARKRKLTLTKKGIEQIKQIDFTADRIIKQLSVQFSKKEFSELTNLFNTFADAYQEPLGLQRANENAYRVQQRRLTRALGLLGENNMSTGYNSTQWHALSEVVLSPVSPTMNELSELVGLAQNSLSTVIDKFVQLGLIKRVVIKQDRRSVGLHATQKGKTSFLELEQKVSMDFVSRLKATNSKITVKQCTLLKKFVGCYQSTWPILSTNYLITNLTTTEQLATARAAAANQLIACQLDQYFPASFLATTDCSYLLQQANKILAILTISKSKNISFASWQPNTTAWTLLAFINSILRPDNHKGSINIKSLTNFEPLVDYLSKS